MGLNLKDLVVREKTTLEAFSNKIIAIDAYNAIYQFLASIRGADGLQLSDSEGRITSHLSGLLYRNVNFLSLGIKPPQSNMKKQFLRGIWRMQENMLNKQQA